MHLEYEDYEELFYVLPFKCAGRLVGELFLLSTLTGREGHVMGPRRAAITESSA